MNERESAGLMREGAGGSPVCKVLEALWAALRVLQKTYKLV